MQKRMLWRVKGKVLLTVLIVFCTLLLIGMITPVKTRPQQIKEGCERESGTEGPKRVQACQLEIVMRELDAGERAKMERAAR